ncbi:hypothetical protein T01_3905 [Trichinella spiralis]|uniref:Uncharacterized protein n=1 Tax=Trichinella spiralis TaxID=6334 RepID=A0A0V1C1W8_TRISP|nr:hypothetical protein T01_3905 [Trichinella spiralis]
MNALNFKKQQHSTIQLVSPLPLTPTPQKITKGNKISAVDWCINFHDRLHRCKHPGCERFESKSTCFSNKYTTTPHTSMLRLKHFTQTTHKPKRAHQPAGKLTLASCTTAVVLALGRISFGRRFSAASCATPSISSCCSLFQTGRRKTAATRPTALFSHLQQSRELCAFYTRNCCNFSNDQLAASSTVNEQIMDLIETRRSAGSLYTEMIKDAYRPAKRHCIRSQSTIDLQAVVSGHLRHPADGTYSAPDEVVDRGIGPQTSDTTDETADSYHFRHRFRCRSSPPPQHVWVAKTTGTFYKPLYEQTNVYGNRRYYSRYGNNDPDYFDWDLDAAVSRVKEQQAISYGRPPVQPRYWEHELFKDMTYLQGEKLISPYLFNKTDDSSNFTKTSYVSSALRTPSYWTYRFENL